MYGCMLCGNTRQNQLYMVAIFNFTPTGTFPVNKLLYICLQHCCLLRTLFQMITVEVNVIAELC